jgi:hypothetical protein
MRTVVVGELTPRATLIAHLDSHVLPWAYLGTYGELSFGLTGIAVNHRVGSQLGGAKNDFVSDWASVEKFRQIKTNGTDGLCPSGKQSCA